MQAFEKIYHNSFEADKWPSSFIIKCSYVVFYNKKYMSLTFQMCDRITNYGLCLSIQSNITAVYSSVLHTTANYKQANQTYYCLPFPLLFSPFILDYEITKNNDNNNKRRDTKATSGQHTSVHSYNTTIIIFIIKYFIV